jgi:hypothetical protein
LAYSLSYQFKNLQSFLDLYFEGCKIRVAEGDFRDVNRAYLKTDTGSPCPPS